MSASFVTVSLRQLLDDPDLGLVLVAGSRGVADTTVTWAHISEIPDPTRWLRGGELLLTTGLGVRDSPDLQRRLVAALANADCPALGFGIGIWLDAVPDAMRDQADRLGFPIFTVPYDVPFIAVTRYVSRRVFEAHDRGLRRALDLHRRMLAAVTSGGGFRDVLAATAQAVGADIVLFDPFGQVLGSVGDALDAKRVWQLLPSRPAGRTRIAPDEQVITASQVRVADETEAVIAIVSDDELDDRRTLFLEQAVSAIAVVLSRQTSARTRRRTAVASLLDDIRASRIGVARAANRLAALGLDPERPYRVLAALPSDGMTAGSLCRLAEDAAEGQRVLVGVLDDAVVLVVQPADLAITVALQTAARSRRQALPRIGRSHPREEVSGLPIGLREAAFAAANAEPGAVVDVATAGIDGLLAAVGDAVAPEAFIADVLGPLLDRRDASVALLAALRAYIAHGCRPGPAAAELEIHRHTLRYRLDRITELTGRDPRLGDHAITYGVAFALHNRRARSRT